MGEQSRRGSGAAPAGTGSAAPPARTGRSPRRVWFGRVLGLLIVAAIFGKALPELVDLERVAHILRTRVQAPELALLMAFTVLSVLLSAVGLSAALPGLRILPASVINVVTTALSYAVPGGGAAGAALNVTMSRELGFRPAPIALQMLVTGVWNLLARLVLPLLALGLLAVASDVSEEVRAAGVVGLAAALLLVVLAGLMLWHDRAAAAIVSGASRAARPVARLLHRDIRDHGGDVAGFQAGARTLIRSRWPALTLSAFGYHLCLFAVLYVSLQAAGATRVGVLEAFAVYTIARQVTAIPLTPGGAGVIELALIGGLDLTGADLPAVTAGVLLFRFFTYLLYLPAGGVLWAWWRWVRPASTGGGNAERTHRPAFRHPMDAVRLAAGLAALALLALPSRGLPGWDADLFRLVNNLTDAIEAPMWLVTQAGWLGAAGLAALAAAALRRFRAAAALGTAGALAWLLAKVVEEVADRPRPAALLDGVVLRADAAAWGTGFAAGHTAVAAALATVASAHVPRPYRRLLWLAVAAVGTARVYAGAHFPLDVLGGAALGWAAGAAVLLLLGTPGHRPHLAAVRDALGRHGIAVTGMRPVPGDMRHAVPLIVTTPDGPLFVKVIGRDQRDADALHRLGRLWRRRPGEPPFATAKHLAEHEGYLLMRARGAGARVPDVRFVTETTPGTWALVMEHVDGVPAPEAGESGPETLDDLWGQLTALRRDRIAHRALLPENILIDPRGRAWIVGWSRAETDTVQALLDEDAARLEETTGTAPAREPAMAAAAAAPRTGEAAAAARPASPAPGRTARPARRRRPAIRGLRPFPPKSPATARHPADVLRVLAGLGAGIALAVFAADGYLLRVEADVFRLVNGLPDRLFGPVNVVMQAGALGAVAVTAAAALAVRRVRLAVDLALGGTLAWLLAKLVKELADRGRPGALLPEAVLRGAHESGLGFVSGHAAVAAALATVASAHVARPVRWALWTAAAAVALGRVYVGAHLPLDVVAGAALGWAIGGAVHLLRGTPNHVPSPEQVAAGLARCGLPDARVRPFTSDARGSVPFTAAADGRTVFVKALGRDQRDADLLFKTARFLLYREVEDETPMAGPKRQVEHEAYMLMRAAAAGARVPAVIGVAPAGSGTWILAEESMDATGLDGSAGREVDGARLRALWTEVAALRGARIAHRDLRLSNVLIDGRGRPVLVDFGFAEDAASDARLAQDVAELLVSTALVAGTGPAVEAAVDVLGLPAVDEAVPYLQPLALARSTRNGLRERPHLLDELRSVIAATGGTRAGLRPLSRLPSRPWMLLLLLAGGYATAHLLIGITGPSSPAAVLGDVHARWLAVAALLVTASYAGGALALMGASLRDLALGRTYLRQVAASYASRQRQAGQGGGAVLGSYLHGHGAGPDEAAETVALTRLTGALVHLAALALAIASVLARGPGPLRMPSWSQPLILTVTALAAFGAVLAWRRRGEIVVPLRGAPAALRRRRHRPRRLIALIAGSSLVTSCSVLAFLSVAAALSVPLPPVTLAALYLLLIPTRLLGPLPGGVGVVEPLLVLALVSLGTGPTEAVLTVLIYRVASFWLPIVPGALSFHLGHRTDTGGISSVPPSSP
ncbi:phosphatase PAP2 family protein [Spirillospora albida]|uniref:phosphatase PAP2 family protein n=1 Tax=Spirillospora albida TaxID=58123 RepID=UPI00068DD87A|nr:phosphatase PAP2 family protein [Spirillospora albida]